MKAPLEMPTSAVSTQVFEIQREDYLSPEASGRIGGVQAGQALWSGSWTFPDMLLSQSDALRAFFSQVRGAVRWFLARDLKRLYPAAYRDFTGLTRAGGGSFDGSATSWSESVTADGDQTITLNGLPANFAMGIGDYIGLRWTATEAAVAGLTWSTVVRAVEAKTASSGGVLSAIMVEPPIPLAVPSAAIAYLNNPACVMKLITSQSSLQPIDSYGAVVGGQIVGVQDIRS